MMTTTHGDTSIKAKGASHSLAPDCATRSTPLSLMSEPLPVSTVPRAVL